VYNNDPIFKHAKVLYSIYTDTLSKTLNKGFEEIATINDLKSDDLNGFRQNNAFNLNGGATSFSDAILFGNSEVETEFESLKASMPHLPYMEESELLPALVDFYKSLLTD
jgi:starch synthase